MLLLSAGGRLAIRTRALLTISTTLRDSWLQLLQQAIEDVVETVTLHQVLEHAVELGLNLGIGERAFGFDVEGHASAFIGERLEQAAGDGVAQLGYGDTLLQAGLQLGAAGEAEIDAVLVLRGVDIGFPFDGRGSFNS